MPEQNIHKDSGEIMAEPGSQPEGRKFAAMLFTDVGCNMKKVIEKMVFNQFGKNNEFA
jgi:hypothetical protein